ncbi:MAG TPA: hypothetical protein VK701_05715 [Solirubrobacteraceae bacterium]|jgi:hypothetical protein|nr:hypothetical protein [Solirubrobacteraceae bacterium]
MPRKHDAHKDELEGVAQRLRDERPTASPLDLDRIKTTAMARAKSAGTRRGRAGARRLAVASLTVGLLAAGTGSVFAWSGGSDGKGTSGNAANAQYGGECNISNGNGNIGNENGSNAENYACNENSFNKNTINETNNTTNNVTNNITNSYNGSTVTVTSPTNNGVLGTSTTKKATTSNKRVNIHIDVSKKTKLRKVTLKVNGKVVSILKGKAAKANVSIANLPCSATVTITAVTSSGKTVTQTHVYKLC